MSKIKNGGSDQYGPEPIEQQEFGIAGIEGVDKLLLLVFYVATIQCWTHCVFGLSVHACMRRKVCERDIL